ncbi:hypothetical protein Tco_0642382 [Tanacetum coccineum]
MNLIATQQAALDNALVPSEKRLKIERCNARIAFTKSQKEETYQFWNTIKKIGKTDAYNFKLDKKKCRIDTECDMLSTTRTDQMHQPWRTFVAVINRCISGKSIGLNRLRESCAQILWAMYNRKNVDYVALLWEDFMYQSDNREISSARKEHMPYPRFTKVIINHFISKDNTISMWNRINLHTVRDDTLLGTLKFVFKTEDCQKYGAVIPDGMINDDIKLSKAYKTYLDYATGKVPPKKARKFKKPASPKLQTILSSPKEPTQKGKRVKRSAKKATTVPTTGIVIRDTPDKSVSKNKAPTKIGRGKGIELLSDTALLKDAQIKKALKKSKHQTHNLQASSSSEGADFESEVPDEQTDKPKDTNERTGEKPGVPDVFKDDSTDSEADDDNDDSGNDGGNENDYEENPSFTLKDYEEEEQDEEYVYSPEKDKSNDEEKMYEEEDDDVKGVVEDQHKASQESRFMQEEDDGHVTLTTVHDKTEGTTQSSYVSSDFTSKLLNLDNTGPDVNKIASLMNTSTAPPPPPLVNPFLHLITIPQQQIPYSTTTTNPTMTLPKIPNFTSLFQFDQRVSALETKVSEFNQKVNLLKLSP